LDQGSAEDPLADPWVWSRRPWMVACRLEPAKVSAVRPMSERLQQVRYFLAQASTKREATAAAKVVLVKDSGLAAADAARWSYAEVSGRLVEVSGLGAAATLTAAAGLVLEAQRQEEPVVWITLSASTFFPPDFADSGIDLDALVVVRVPDRERAARAADRLVRSGGFGLVVLDLGAEAVVPMALLGRLAGLAQRHDTAIVCVTEKRAMEPSLGSVVSLRAEARRLTDHGQVGVHVHALKDKRQGPGWSYEEAIVPPPGLRFGS
jgi:recombination protein RecA